MKKLLSLSLIGSSLLLGPNSAKADWDKWVIKTDDAKVIREMIYNIPGDVDSGMKQVGISSYLIKIFNFNSNTGKTELINSFQQGEESHIGNEDWRFGQVSGDADSYDSNEGKIKFKANGADKLFVYDIKSNNWTIEDYITPTNYESDFNIVIKKPDLIKTSDGNIAVEHNGTKIIEQKTNGSVQIGSDSNDIDITAEGLNVDGNPLITKKDNGEIHIGKNSLITKSEEETLSDGTKMQPLYAKDADGNKIPINIDGSKLLIDGVEVTAGGDSTQVTTNQNNISTNSSNISSNDTDIAANASNISSNDTDISALQGLISTKSGSTTTARIGDSTKNTLEIGPTTNPTTIDQSGISVSGGNLIKKDSDGNIHIGKNSFVIGDDVLNGAHPIWAEDENGTKIPLNIYGSDLQINGVSVQGQINTNKSNIKNLGSGVAGTTALTAALTALPQTSKESKLSCGVGTGAYSSRYAVGFGCASKVNERVDINAGGSYVFGGSKSYGGGTLDSGVVKAGFVFKLGELNKSTQINMKEKKEFKKEISVLKKNNKNILSKNQKLENQVFTLMARLERLEKIALSETTSKDVAVYKLK